MEYTGEVDSITGVFDTSDRKYKEDNISKLKLMLEKSGCKLFQDEISGDDRFIEYSANDSALTIKQIEKKINGKFKEIDTDYNESYDRDEVNSTVSSDHSLFLSI